MPRRIHEDYFTWLCKLTGVPRNRNPHRSYWNLLHQLHVTPFRWNVHNDGNRGEDGKDLREEFLTDADVFSDEDIWLDEPASMLEMLIALSRRVSFNSYGEPGEWFWKLLENLDLRYYTDALYNQGVAEEVDEALEMVMNRTYSYEGRGGLFPLRNPERDQRRVELWYQMSAYLIESSVVANGPT